MKRNKNVCKDLEFFSDLKLTTKETEDKNNESFAVSVKSINVNDDNKSRADSSFMTNKDKNFMYDTITDSGNNNNKEKVEKHFKYMEIYNRKFQQSSGVGEVITKTDDEKKKIASLYKRFANYKKGLNVRQKGRNLLNKLILGNIFLLLTIFVMSK